MSKNTTKANIDSLLTIMETLRSENGCDWDKKQTPESLTPFAIEEAYELEEAIESGQRENIISELGDLLFQVVFQAQMAKESGSFDFNDVVETLSTKLTTRHPHVFSDEADALSADEVSELWEARKSAKQTEDNLFQLPPSLPSLKSAEKIGKKAKSIKFDWDTWQEVDQQLKSEVAELDEACQAQNKTHIEEELGDVLFTLAQLARKLDIDSDKALRKANQKVTGRILKAHQISGLSWREFCELDQGGKEELWKKVKVTEL